MCDSECRVELDVRCPVSETGPVRCLFEPPPRRILLVRLSAIGDVVHGMHGLAALRAVRPDAYVGWLVEDKAATLLEDHPDLDRLHVYPRRRWRGMIRRDPAAVAREAAAFLAGLRAERYDLSIDLQGNLKSGVLSALSGVPRRIGLARGCDKEGGHLFCTDPVAVPPEGFHRVDRVLALLAPLGVTGPAGERRMAIPDADEREVADFLRPEGLAPGRFAVLHPPTSKRGIAKRWPPERFAALARGLAAEHDLVSVVTYGPGERDLAAEVVREAEGAALLAPPLLRLSALAALLRAAGLFVAGDTGALHLAAFLGTPTVGLFGPKDPKVYAPRGPRVAVVYKGTGGENAAGMNSIDPADVLDAVRTLLDGGREREEPWPDRESGRSAARPAADRCSSPRRADTRSTASPTSPTRARTP